MRLYAVRVCVCVRGGERAPVSRQTVSGCRCTLTQKKSYRQTSKSWNCVRYYYITRQTQHVRVSVCPATCVCGREHSFYVSLRAVDEIRFIIKI